jgi:hypothetical protein
MERFIGPDRTIEEMTSRFATIINRYAYSKILTYE